MVGTPAPADWSIDHWYQGESEVVLDGSRPTLIVFWEAWCPHCREHVPLLLKAEAALDGSGVEFDYYGLPQTKVADEPEAKKYGVTGVPTSIVFVDGKEVGRIPSSGWKHPEVALADLVAAPAP